MIEHLTTDEAIAFLREAMRVLQPGGWLRLAAPDLKRLARAYIDGRVDANRFVESTLMTWERPRGLLRRLKMAVAGPRHHLWMYDGASLSSLLSKIGFRDVTELAAGRTTIPDPGALDLAERAEESIYVEARKPLLPEAA
jgi:predicted SAM-dependent methyltransferase